MESILQNTESPSQFSFFVFESGVEAETKAKFSQVAERHGAEVDVRRFDTSAFCHLPQDFSADAYTRLYAPDELKQFPRILYLDCDLLVERDVQELFEVDLEENIIGAVPNGPAPFIVEFNRRNGFPEDDHVFNSGVLLIDTQRWVQEAIGDRVVSWIEDHAEEVDFPDQEGINYVLKDRVKPLSATWNMEARHYREWWMGVSDWWSQKAEGEELIVHYTGHRKPWKQGTYVPRQRAYRAYLGDTPFSSSQWLGQSRAAFEGSRMRGGLRLMAEAGRVRIGKIKSEIAAFLS
jgi:lipopolysaccharide biosynthesis glycosyltransferase